MDSLARAKAPPTTQRLVTRVRDIAQRTPMEAQILPTIGTETRLPVVSTPRAHPLSKLAKKFVRHIGTDELR